MARHRTARHRNATHRIKTIQGIEQRQRRGQPRRATAAPPDTAAQALSTTTAVPEADTISMPPDEPTCTVS